MGHFAGHAAFVAALSIDDPERVEALLHAAACEPCRLALRDGTRLLSQIDTLPAAQPSSGALARVASAVQSEIDKKAGTAALLRALALGAAAVVAWGALLLTAPRRADSAVAWFTSAALGILALFMISVFASARSTWRVLALTSLSAAVATWAGVTNGWDPELGMQCMLSEFFGSLLLLATAYVSARRGGIWNPPTAVTAACGGAVAGQAALHVTCPAMFHQPHLLAFHTGGVVLAALLGSAATRVFP